MFLLDTNVLSVLMSAQPVPAVAAWFAERPGEFLVTAAVCRAEVLAGIAVLPQGRKCRSLEAAAVALFHDELNGRVLPFDGEAAVAYAEIFAARRRAAADRYGRLDDRRHRTRPCCRRRHPRRHGL